MAKRGPGGFTPKQSKRLRKRGNKRLGAFLKARGSNTKTTKGKWL